MGKWYIEVFGYFKLFNNLIDKIINNIIVYDFFF